MPPTLHLQTTHRLPAVIPLVLLLCGSGIASISAPTAIAQPARAAPASEEEDVPHPFQRRIPVPEFPADAEWLNAGRQVTLESLRGKFVLLDFWTYCCINCMHVLPELKKLEHAYPNELVVIGVHSAKFEAERGRENIEEAILRYEIEHPVVNDSDHAIWNQFGVRSWPTLMLIDPSGEAIWGKGGEAVFADIDAVIRRGLPYYRQRGLLDTSPIKFERLAAQQVDTPLRFPGKVYADASSDRLYVADSNHNRIVVTTLAGELVDTIGSGAIGRRDGRFEDAQFNHPQGMVLREYQLFVADTENHLLRRIDLRSRTVTTLAGTGEQSRQSWPGLQGLGPNDALPKRWVGPPSTTALNSPWALWIHDEDLFIAMAGPHQIWKMTLSGKEIGPFAGNGREDIVDGRLLPPRPYQEGFSSFAQPSGLASDGKRLFVADSEGSSIRAVPFNPRGRVRTIVGTAKLPQARLFTFGDRDGSAKQVLLQHALGIVHHEGQLYITDTYNNKVKAIDASTGETKAIAGSGRPGSGDDPAEFDEPAGITFAKGVLYVADTNNHAIRTIDLGTGAVATLKIAGLQPPSQ